MATDPKKTKVKRKNRVTAVKNADGTTTKTRVRRDGSVKKVKTYKGNKTAASKTVKYRKDGTKKRSLTRPGDKTGTIVRDFDKKGDRSGKPRNRKKVIKKTAKGIGVAVARTAGTVAAMSALSPIMPAIAGATTAGIVASQLKKARPIKSMQNAAKWIKKGVKNKIQTGNRKGITKKKK